MDKINYKIVIFGATGDLYKSKICTALLNLFHDKLLSEDFSILAFARKDFDNESFRLFTKESLIKKIKPEDLDKEKDLEIDDFLEHVHYVKGSFDDKNDFLKIGNFDLCYIATPPALYETLLENIALSGITSSYSRILIEKPFGENLEIAERLNNLIGKYFNEDQIFRTDHYLFKKGLEDIRDKSTKSLWSNKTIEKIKIVLYEEISVGGRGAFYDRLGAFIDVGQNHLLEVLATIVSSREGSNVNIQNSRAEVLEHTYLSDGDDIVKGQYKGYLEEFGVEEDSLTDTFFTINMEVDNDDWRGVKFILSSGKALGRSQSGVEIFFKDKTNLFFSLSSRSLSRDDSYERIFLTGMKGDQSMFVSGREIMAEWRMAEEVLNRYETTPMIIYNKGEDPENII